MTPNNLLEDLTRITSRLIELGLSVDQNYPRAKEVGGQVQVSYANYADTSIALKNLAYSEIYSVLEEKRQFNIKLLDGGLLQFFYCFDSEVLVKHRLCYFPSPTFEAFQNEPELYIDDSLIYADILMKSVLPVPIRFDYSPSDFEDMKHPTSHLTLGQYKNCRIPVKTAVCPSAFANFIIRSFYNNALLDLPQMFKKREVAKSITENEEGLLHICP